MNERIKELIQMADLCAAGLMASGASEEEIQNRSKVVLAELIVRECANHCDLLLDHKMSSEWSRGTHDCSKAIKKHFGVEE
jgi:hypothetical protein